MNDKMQGPDAGRGRRPAARAILFAGIIVCAAVGWMLAGRMAPETAAPAHPRTDLKSHRLAFENRTTRKTAPVRQKAVDPAFPENAKAGEAILRFKSDEAMMQFLANPPAGVRILGSESRLRAVRVACADAAALNALRSMGESTFEFNFIVSVPEIPDPDKIASMGSGAPFGAAALRWLGVSDRAANWGSGVRVAILDSGVQAHPSLNGVSIRSLDLIGGSVSGPYSGHATAVASLLAGAGDIMGVSPGVEILDLRVLEASGTGDSFTLATAIMRAVDMGAQVISLSLGTYGDSSLVRDAVNYALERNIAIVAAAGNDGFNNLTYPARYPGVISVGSIDATGNAAPFSNTSAALSIVAPGTAVTAAWLDGASIDFSGTSASVPFVTGAIAYLLADQRYLSPSAAAGIVLQNADDAGAPGYDASYGRGILDLARLKDRQTAGLYDLAVASHWIDASQAMTPGSIPVQVTVQNRGTVAASYATLKITDGQSSEQFTIPSLAPGAISTHSFQLKMGGTDGGAPPFIQSSVSLSGVRDARPQNNYRTTILAPLP